VASRHGYRYLISLTRHAVAVLIIAQIEFCRCCLVQIILRGRLPRLYDIAPRAKKAEESGLCSVFAFEGEKVRHSNLNRLNPQANGSWDGPLPDVSWKKTCPTVTPKLYRPDSRFPANYPVFNPCHCRISKVTRLHSLVIYCRW